MAKLILKGDHAEIDGTPKEIIEIIEHFMKLGQMQIPSEIRVKKDNPLTQ